MLGEKMEKILFDLIESKSSKKIHYKEFIETALYHPTKGYYQRNVIKIGKNGDFYTSSNVGDVFGRTLGRWFAYCLGNFSIEPVIVELGGGTGKIAQNILSFMKTHHPTLLEKLKYIIVEKSQHHQNIQKQLLSKWNQVEFYTNIESLGELNGIIFSNELFDAFPVHVIEKRQNIYYEVWIVKGENGLEEHLEPLSDKGILDYLKTYDIKLKNNQRLEIPLPMMDFYESLVQKLERGILLSVDYGYTNEEWNDPLHREGSLRGYYQHKMIRDVLKHPGEMDITHHIHWDSLMQCGLNYGFQYNLLMEQTEFLISCGILKDLEETFDPNPFSEASKRNRAIRSLLMPGGISSYFRALVQCKNVKGCDRNLFPEKV